MVVEARRMEAQARVGPEDGVAPQVLVDRDAQGVTGVEARPADRAEVGALVLFRGQGGRCGGRHGGFLARREQGGDLRKFEADLEAGGRAGQRVGGAAEVSGELQQLCRRHFSEQLAGLGIEQHPSGGADVGKGVLLIGRDHEQRVFQLNGGGFGEGNRPTERGAVHQHRRLGGGLQAEPLVGRG